MFNGLEIIRDVMKISDLMINKSKETTLGTNTKLLKKFLSDKLY